MPRVLCHAEMISSPYNPLLSATSTSASACSRVIESLQNCDQRRSLQLQVPQFICIAAIHSL